MAEPILRKLQHRAGTEVLVLWSPDEFDDVLHGWADDGVAVRRRMRGNTPFVLAFVRSCAEITQRAERLVSLLGGDDPILWIAYPKKSSKRYRSDIGRDDSWGPVGALGFEPVRQIALDDDWSALRFRRTEQVKTLTRSRAISEAGKRRIASKPSTPRVPAIDAWVAALDEPRRSFIGALHDTVRQAAPGLVPSLEADHGRIGYGPFHYRYESGREGDAHRVTVANNARYVSVYVLATDDSCYIPSKYSSRLGDRVSVGKSCIQIKKLEDVDLDVLAEVVSEAAEIHRQEA